MRSGLSFQILLVKRDRILFTIMRRSTPTKPLYPNKYFIFMFRWKLPTSNEAFKVQD